MNELYPWRTGRSCTFKLFCHLVFVTKYRRKVLSDEMLIRVEELMSETCDQMGCELLEFNGEDDHVHLLINFPPKLALANLVGKLKGKSAFFIRREYWKEVKKMLWGRHFWSPSYCAVSCGGAPLEIIKAYIEKQRRPPTKKGIDASIRLTKNKRITNIVAAR